MRDKELRSLLSGNFYETEGFRNEELFRIQFLLNLVLDKD